MNFTFVYLYFLLFSIINVLPDGILVMLCCCHMCEDVRVRRARNLCLSLSRACAALQHWGLS